MSDMTRSSLFLAVTGLCIALPVTAVIAQATNFDALTSLERGEWELKERGSAKVTQRLCIGDPGQLLQPHHPNLQCKRFVLRNSANNVAITYDCAQAGQGRTALRVETARLVQIDSQGVSDGAPFALLLEGRRIGACKTAALRR
jgi:hypothetical protein